MCANLSSGMSGSPSMSEDPRLKGCCAGLEADVLAPLTSSPVKRLNDEAFGSRPLLRDIFSG